MQYLFERMRGGLKAVLMLAAVVFMTAGVAQAQTTDEIVKRGKILIGVCTEAVPVCFLDEKQESVGFEIELAKMLAERMGVELELVQVPGASRIQYLLAGKVDILIAFLGVTPERALQVDYSAPYFTSDSNVLASADLAISSYEDLKNLRVAVVRGTTSDRFLTKRMDELEVVDLGPRVNADRVYFGDTYGFVYALKVETGEEVWRFETEGKIEGGINTMVPESGPARIYVGSHDYFLYCLSADKGEVLWKHETGNYVVSTPSMIQSGGTTSIAFGGCDGLLHVLAADGQGEKREIEIGAYIANTSAVRDGICYVAHNGGEVVAVDIASGETAWKTTTGIEYTASPAVDEKLLYVAGPDKRLVAYDRVEGTEKWAFLSPRALASSPLVSGDLIWQGGMDGRLYAINRADGKEVWNFEVGTQIKASPAASRGTLVVCGEDGVVYGFTVQPALKKS